MDAAPKQVRLKRKRTDAPPDTLILSSLGLSGEESEGSSQKKICYRLARDRSDNENYSTTRAVNKQQSPFGGHVTRTFRINRPSGAAQVTQRREDGPDQVPELPVVVETHDSTARSTTSNVVNNKLQVKKSEESFKRPGLGSRLPQNRDVAQNIQAQTPADNHNVQALADLMDRFAMEVLAKDSATTPATAPAATKAHRLGQPRMTAEQSKRRHEQNVLAREKAKNEAAARMAIGPTAAAQEEEKYHAESGVDFVYDIYELTQGDENFMNSQESVGWLIIDDEDQEYLTLVNGMHNDTDPAAVDDSDDENAEGYYTNDYPEEAYELDDGDEVEGDKESYSDDEEFDLRYDDYDDMDVDSGHPGYWAAQAKKFGIA